MKNPIAVALGNVLRETRNTNSIPFEDLTKDIGINSSYYRLLESGTHTIHISKTIDVVKSFNDYGASISYDGLAKLVMGVYFTQPLVKLAIENDDSFDVERNKLLTSLESYDPKLFLLIRQFDELNLFSNTKITGKALVGLLETKKIFDLVTNFLNNYSEFGEDLNAIQNEYLNSFFDNVPSIYIKFLYDVKSNIKSMPTNIGVSNLWQWETANKKEFIELNAFVEDSTSVTSVDNLERYSYRYLWQNNFKKAVIYYSDNKDESIVLRDFKKNLSTVVKGTEFENEFENAFNKIEVKKVRNFIIPKGSLFLEKRGIHYKPNSAWVFSMENKINVGFVAEINPENDLLSNGESLNIKSTYSLLEQFEKIKK